MLSPSLTLPCTSSTARDRTLLLTVSVTMSSDCRIGTPDCSRIDSVLANRDSADLWKSCPNTGALSFARSTTSRPRSVFFHFLNRKTPTPRSARSSRKYFWNALDAPIRIFVGSGSEPFSWA